MNLEQIGKFISELRKEQGLTQVQLGEKIGVTNKTVSRWETGTYLPPAEDLILLSELFSVSINEILSGRRLSDGEYRKSAEDNLVQAVRQGGFTAPEKMEFYKRKWLKEHIAAMCVYGLAIIAAAVFAVTEKDPVLGYAAAVMLVAGHGVRNNKMMAYAESRAYDGRGSEVSDQR